MMARGRRMAMARILIVDDDPDVTEACRLFLEKEGHEVFSALSRDEGMQGVQDHKPDLLILDVMMELPDDGLAMARDLRKGGFTAPILMLTSLSKITGMDYGADEELVPVDAFEEKPIAPAKLVARVQELLGR
jgi:DNA-binding response OmpR family regulator